MSTGERLVGFAPMVRGDIMNAMVPVTRQGEVIGYIWANELTDDIHAQMAAMDRNIYLAVSLGIIISLLLFFWLNRGFIRDVGTIKNGLEQIRFDLDHRIAPLEGEMGQIGEAINHMTCSLLNAQTLNQNIMHSIADGVITVDIDGNITSANKSAEMLTGYTSAEIVDKPYKEIFCEGKHFNSLLLDTLATGASYIGVETDYPVKNRSIHISISTSRLKDSTNQIIGAVVVFKDLTEQHRLQEQMLRAERLASLGEIMAGVAHEIRNPLTAIKGFVQYLQVADTEAERKEYMPVIIKEVDRVNRVIETLLYFSRDCKADYKPMNINDLIEETLVLVKNTGTRHRLEFKLQLAQGLPWVEGDAEQLKQVLLNLLINAVQAVPEQGMIAIKTWQEQAGAVQVRITDTGQGIDEAELSKVFDPFFTTKAAGTGLGLAVVQRIMNAHNGRIDIQSEVGKGTAVTLEIPVVHQGGETDE
jgi:two-component system sensor histidine kinase AtoS